MNNTKYFYVNLLLNLMNLSQITQTDG